MVALRLTLLGAFDARLAAGGAVSVPSRKAEALLAYLGLRPGQPHRRDALAALLWGERGDERARDGLRHALLALRRVLPAVVPPLVRIEGQTLALNPVAVEVDVATFERRVAESTPAALAHAAELYRGDLLLGFSLAEPLFEDWLVAERERLRQMALETLTRLLAHQSRNQDTEPAIQTAVRLLRLDPLQEAVHRTLMRLYARQGRRGAALRQYQTCVAGLQRELRVEPEAGTRALYQEILRQPPPGTGLAEASSTAGSAADSPPRPTSPVPTATAPDPAATAVLGWADVLPRDCALVGRAAEMGRLRGATERVERGRGEVVAMLGEAGVGKSRMAAELAAERSPRGWRILVGRACEAERSLPFAPWVDALRAGSMTRDARELAPVWRAGLCRLLPEMGELPPAAAADPDDRLLVFQSVAEVVTALAARQPVLLVLEDLHWADEASLGLLGFVGRRLRRARVLALITAREEDLPEAAGLSEVLDDLDRHGRLERLALPPLSRVASLALVRALAPELRGESGEAVAEQLWAESQGNPFVLIETLRVIRDSPNGLGTATRLVVPRVKDAIIRRLERLTAAARELTTTAALIGREAEFRVLQGASGLEEDEAARAVEELVRRRMLVAQGERFNLAHDRIRQAALSRLLPPRRRLVHRRIGEALERVYAGALEAHAGTLGRHFLGAEVWDRAASYLSSAGRTAVHRSAYREAAALYEQGLNAVERQTESPQRLVQGIDVRLDLAGALSALDRYDRVSALAIEAETLATRLGDRRRLARATTLSSFGLVNTGQPVAAVDAGRRAVDLAGELADLALAVHASQRLGMAYLSVGELARAADCLRRTVRALDGEDAAARLGESLALWHRAMAQGRLCVLLAEMGAFAESLAHGRDAVELARSTGRPIRVITERTRLGEACLIKGDVADAIPLLEQALAEARKHDVLEWAPVAASCLAHAYAVAGRLSEAVPLAEEAEQLAPGRTEIIRRLGEVYATARRLNAALDSARRAVALARERQERGKEAKALRLLGEIAACHDSPDAVEAEARYLEARALAERLGFRPEVARCHLGLGRVLSRVGLSDRAREHREAAATLFRDMGMTWWLGQLDAEADRAGHG